MVTKNPYLLTVNQKLAFARIQLKAASLPRPEK